MLPLVLNGFLTGLILVIDLFRPFLRAFIITP